MTEGARRLHPASLTVRGRERGPTCDAMTSEIISSPMSVP